MQSQIIPDKWRSCCFPFLHLLICLSLVTAGTARDSVAACLDCGRRRVGSSASPVAKCGAVKTDHQSLARHHHTFVRLLNYFVFKFIFPRFSLFSFNLLFKEHFRLCSCVFCTALRNQLSSRTPNHPPIHQLLVSAKAKKGIIRLNIRKLQCPAAVSSQHPVCPANQWIIPPLVLAEF